MRLVALRTLDDHAVPGGAPQLGGVQILGEDLEDGVRDFGGVELDPRKGAAGGPDDVGDGGSEASLSSCSVCSEIL